MYTTGDIARFFGVTVATINDYIQHNRLTGVEKGMIPGTAIYISITGEKMTIKEIAEIYEKEQQRTTIQTIDPTQELNEILNAIVFFENKYRGEHKNTLALKEVLTADEERDAAEWKYLLQSIEEHHS